MYNLIRYIIRYHLSIAFIILEAIAIVLMAHTSYFRHSAIMAKADAIKGMMGQYTNTIVRYFLLQSENNALIQENTELKNRLDRMISTFEMLTDTIPDSPYRSFVYTTAKVVENSLNKRNNYIILNVGNKHNITKDMGVITADGIVGVVDRVSENFCTVMSLLNSSRNFDVKLKKTGHHGPMEWNGKDIHHIDIINIPHHINVAVGDSVMTSGYSMTFPEGIFVGTVNNFTIERGTSYRINVKLANDFQTIDRVYVLESIHKNGLDSIKNSINTLKKP